jgi:hypothetical protein
MDNYFSFVNQREKEKLITTRLTPGRQLQLRLKYDAAHYPDFLFVELNLMDAFGQEKDITTTEQFTLFKPGDPSTYPTENACSQVITINYGNFKYYTGGDIPGNVQYGQSSWMDVETPVSKAIGAVDVATMDHHGNRDVLNENLVRTLRPRVWIEQVWSADHPGHEVLIRATTPYLYPGPRDLFATNMLQANKDVIGPLIDRSYKSTQGHILYEFCLEGILIM